MARVLIGWEFGGGRGHVAVVAPLARRLVEAGHRVTLALRPGAPGGDLGLPECEIVPAPSVLGPSGDGLGDAHGDVHTLADVLVGLGMANPARLAAQMEGWRDLIASERPDAVVCEFAPGLAVAALGALPVTTLGVGYVCPPAQDPLPPVRPWGIETPAASREAEARLARSVAAVRRDLGRPPLPSIGALLHGDAQVVCTWPELDPYAARRSAAAAGPSERPVFAPSPEGSRDGPAFFYLVNDARLSSVLEALAASGVAARGYVRGVDAAGARALSLPGVQVHATPQPLAEVLAGCPVLIHHGGIGAAEAALAAGTPQIVLARHLEQVVNGVAIERRLRTGKAFLAEAAADRPELLTDFIRRMARSTVVRERASALSRELAARDAPAAADLAARLVLRGL